MINNTLYKYLDLTCIVYLNNILIYSKDKKSYIKYIKQVLDVLRSRDLKLKLEKYKFFKKEVKFLGYIVTTTKLKIDSKKVEAV